MKKAVAVVVAMVCMACVSHGELYTNTSFEDDHTGWDVWGSGSGSGAAGWAWVSSFWRDIVEDGTAHSGAKYVTTWFDNGGLDWSVWGWGYSLIYRDVPVIPGETYTASVWVKDAEPDGSTNTFKSELVWEWRTDDGSGNRPPITDVNGDGERNNGDKTFVTNQIPKDGVWVNIVSTQVAPPGADWVTVPISCANMTDVMGIDDFSLIGPSTDIGIAQADLNLVDGNFSLSFNSIVGTAYEIQAKDDLADWGPLAMDYPAGGATSDLTTFLDPVPAAGVNQRLYRVAYIPPQPVFFDDLETGAVGWTKGVDAGTTEWELGAPTVVGPAAPYSGNNCYGTDLDDAYNLDGNAPPPYPDIWLRTPPIDLTGETGATLSFYHYLDVDSDPNFHWGEVNVLDTSGTVLVDDLLKIGVPANSDWVRRFVVLPAEGVGQEIVLEFRLVIQDNFGPYNGWYIDDVMVMPAP